ncbi:hypothetical protein [Sulfitobacter sp. F26169L]|uniref:hypothetical protein n=1 Tax=Sulfitobacter sp. F26169L TaxID=2996015 RepID=UPI002260894B|nr:hypothetical protein [Sulfitobacter sp. F26169L]
MIRAGPKFSGPQKIKVLLTRVEYFGPMILGYLILAVVAGSLSSSLALLFGFSFLFAFGVYTAVGTITLIALPLTSMLIGALSPNQKKATPPRNLRTGRRTVNIGEGSIDHV